MITFDGVGRRLLESIYMTKPVRYQKGSLFDDQGAWFVRYREPIRQKDGSVKFRRQTKRLGDVESFPRAADIEPLRVSFMQRINHDRSNGDSARRSKNLSIAPICPGRNRNAGPAPVRDIGNSGRITWPHASVNCVCAKFGPLTLVACSARLPRRTTTRKTRFSTSSLR